MERPEGHCTKCNKSERETQILYDIINVESKNYNNLVNITKQKQTYRYRKVASINKGREKRREGEYCGRGLRTDYHI